MFSTTTVCPSERRMRSASMRASVSVGPPADYDTTIDSGLVGKHCAMVGPAATMLPATTKKAKTDFTVVSISATFLQMHTGFRQSNGAVVRSGRAPAVIQEA